MGWSQALAELDRSAANRVPEGNHQSIFRHVSRLDRGLLVSPSDSNQYLMCSHALNDLRRGLNIGNGWHSDNNRIRLVPFYRYQPVAERKVCSKVEYGHPSPTGRSGVRQNAELVMTTRG